MFSRSANSPGDPLSRRSTRLPLNTPFSLTQRRPRTGLVHRFLETDHMRRIPFS
jgi:hypothetical protein